MYVALLVVAGLMVWVGATLMIDGWIRRPRRPDLAEPLWRYRLITVADEAQEWLDQHT
jgi:hypothetical protein